MLTTDVIHPGILPSLAAAAAIQPYQGRPAMTEQIAIAPGRPPWLPAADAEPVLVLHDQGTPLIGVVRQRGHHYLFRCVEGQLDSVNVWAYTWLSVVEMGVLAQVQGNRLDTVVDAVSNRRPTVVAVAHEDRRISLSALIAHPDNFPSLLHAAGVTLGRAATEVKERVVRTRP